MSRLGAPKPSAAADELTRRLSLLEEIATDRERLPAGLAARAVEVASTARARLGHGTGHTVVALAGGTGSGKSSLFNALAGGSLSTVGIRRPTTSVTQAAVYGEGAEALLDWLQIDHRHRLADASFEGLVLLDLPDHDSTAAAHLAEVDRLVEVVDVFCWVVDPQKYADAALHEGYLRNFATHGSVTLVALNQIDRLPTVADRQACVVDLSRLLTADGLPNVRVLPVSAVTGEGVDALRRELLTRVAERRAVVARIGADIDWLGSDLAVACGDTAVPAEVPTPARARLLDAAVAAAGDADVALAVDKAFRHRSSLAVGWPPLRWVRNLRPDPLRRLGLDRPKPENELQPATGTPIAVRRSNLGVSTVGMAQLEATGRDVARQVGTGLPIAWQERLSTQMVAGINDIADPLDAAVASVSLPVDPPRWWTVVGLVQRLVSLAMLVGLAWLVLIAVLAWLHVPELPLPKWHGWPLPTLLAVGGALAGFLIATLGRRLASVGARRRANKARKLLRESVATVVDHRLIAPTNTELAALAALATNVRRLA